MNITKRVVVETDVFTFDMRESKITIIVGGQAIGTITVAELTSVVDQLNPRPAWTTPNNGGYLIR